VQKATVGLVAQRKTPPLIPSLQHGVNGGVLGGLADGRLLRVSRPSVSSRRDRRRATGATDAARPGFSPGFRTPGAQAVAHIATSRRHRGLRIAVSAAST